MSKRPPLTLQALADVLGHLDQPWGRLARCKGRARLMNPTGEDVDQQNEAAKRICRTCPAHNACQNWVLALPEQADPGGICGGLTETERTKRRRGRITAPAGHKRCPRCETVKKLDEFYVNRAKADGRNSWCKPCARESMSAIYRQRRAVRT